MAITRIAAYGIYPRHIALSEVVAVLNRAGFRNDNICVVLSPGHPDAGLFRDSFTSGCGCKERGDAVRVIRWFCAFGAVVIPTVGVFIHSQPFLDTLLRNSDSTLLSRGSHALFDLGFPADEAKRLGDRLCDFGAMVYINCPEDSQRSGAVEVLRRSGAHEAAGIDAWHATAAAA